MKRRDFVRHAAASVAAVVMGCEYCAVASLV